MAIKKRIAVFGLVGLAFVLVTILILASSSPAGAKMTLASSSMPRREVNRCRDFSIGPAGYANILVTRVTCQAAKRLLDRTMLGRVRQGRSTWTYSGFRWWFIPTEVSAGRIVGTSGLKLVTADFGVS